MMYFSMKEGHEYMRSYGNDLFSGTARYYSLYRPLYPYTLIRFLIHKFALDGTGQMLDLGCGDGRLALRFVDWFETILGVDQEPEMIEEARCLQKESRYDNIEWLTGNLDKFNAQQKKTFKMITIAKAFHWMEREKTLEMLFDMTSIGGGIAIIDPCSKKNVRSLWQNKVDEVIKHWYGSERRAGNTIYQSPSENYEQLIERSKFKLDKVELPPYEQRWSIDSIIGNIYSTSYGAKHFLGDNVHLFEEHLKKELLAIEPTNIFKENIHLSVILALKQGE